MDSFEWTKESSPEAGEKNSKNGSLGVLDDFSADGSSYKPPSKSTTCSEVSKYIKLLDIGILVSALS